MGDFNNDGEKLVEQRNESSVLFSLDSLSSIGDGSDEADGGFGNAGDKSGLIDLNTLAAMGSEGSAQFSSSDDEFTGNAPVFNKVKSKSEARKTAVIIAIVVVVIIGLCVAGYLGLKKYEEATADAAQRQAELEAQLKQEQAERDKALAEKEQQIKQLEADMKTKALDEKALKEYEQLKKQVEADKAKIAEENAAANANNAVKKPTTKPNTNTNNNSDTASNGGGSSAPQKKGGAPDSNAVKAALQASNTKAGKCGKGGNLKVSMTLNPNGKASNIKAASGTFMGTPTEKCIITVVSNSTFPTYSGAPIGNVTWNYKL